MTPRVKFRINKALDKKIALAFLDAKAGGIDFSEGITDLHPNLRKIRKIKNAKKKKSLLYDYFESFYGKNRAALNDALIEFSKEWEAVESRFFAEAKRLFRSHPFPPGKYIGYLSIVNCNPRFLRNRIFQVFYLHPKGVRYVTAHELLHFIFFDYAIKRYPSVFKKLDTDTGIFWDISEIFNSIILHTPNFIKIHKIRKRVFYPVHKEYLPKLTKIWRMHPDADAFILRAYHLLNGEK